MASNFIYDLNFKFLLIFNILFCNIINNTICPIYIMKLSIKFFEKKIDKGKDKNFKLIDMKKVNHLLIYINSIILII